MVPSGLGFARLPGCSVPGCSISQKCDLFRDSAHPGFGLNIMDTERMCLGNFLPGSPFLGSLGSQMQKSTK